MYKSNWPESKQANPEYKLELELQDEHIFWPEKAADVPTEQMLQTEEPSVEEYWPLGQLEHWLAPMNIVCVDVNSVFTLAADSTLVYIRKSLMPPFK